MKKKQKEFIMIAVYPKTKQRFDKLLEPRETSDQLLNRLIDEHEGWKK